MIWKMRPSETGDSPYLVKQQLWVGVVRYGWRGGRRLGVSQAKVRFRWVVCLAATRLAFVVAFVVGDAGNSQAVSVRSPSSSSVHRRTLAPTLLVRNLLILTLNNRGFLWSICWFHMSELFAWYVGGLIWALCLTHGQCEGVSMLPTFNYWGDWLFERKLSLSQLQTLKRGDLVTFRSPSSPMTLVCKRVIGLAGDVVNVDPIDLEMSKQHCLIPEGHVWVQGDNAAASIDSRTYGPLPMGLIQAKIVCRVRCFLSGNMP